MYFLAMEMTRRRFASTISFLAWRASRSPCHLHDPAELADLEPGLARQLLDLVAVLLDFLLVAGDEALPASRAQLGYAIQPERIELGALVVLEKILARDAVALVADQALVDVVELLDQRVDARLIEL